MARAHGHWVVPFRPRVHGKEWTFSSGGVFSHAPRAAPSVQFSHAVVVERCTCRAKSGGYCRGYVLILSGRAIIAKNCNVFANDLAIALTGKAIPGYVNRLARIGVCFSCLLPNHLRDQSPVNEFDGAGGGARRGPAPVVSFTGTGRSLSSSSSSTESSSSQTASERRRLMAAAAAPCQTL